MPEIYFEILTMAPYFTTITVAWIYLLVAGLFEIAWAIGLKYTEGFSRFWPSLMTITCMILSFYCVSVSLRLIPMGVAYAVWTGIGAAGVVLLSAYFFGESLTLSRILCIFIIIVGIVGLKYGE